MRTPVRPIATCAFALLAAGAPPSTITAQAAPSPAPPAPLAPLAFLAGSCWKGTMPDHVASDEHCFTWVFGRQFLRDRHVVRNGRSPYAGETMYTVDGATQQVWYTYWNSDGMTMRGTMESRGDSLIFPTRVETPTGLREIMAVWTRLGPDRYRVSQAQKVGDEWKPFMTIELTRQRRPAPR